MNEEEFHKRTTEPGVPPDQKEKPIPAVPEQIGPYKIEAFLDKGGMSLLYLGVHPEIKETTVVKVLSPKYLSRPEVVERFLNEAEIIAMANHPNIVKLYGQGEWEEGLYIAMEFIEGISLRQYMLQNSISLKHALEIIIEISYALCHLHTHGVIHRDLKPENILVTESGNIKVIDFGIAQLLTEQAAPGEPPRQILIGTPIYISPEQRENPESVGYPSDIYSLGIVSYELILGKLSHGRIHLSLIPKGMQKILTKALQPDPENRYQDIVDFIADLSDYMNSEEIEEDKKLEDQLSELSEDLRNAQKSLIPKTLPSWPEVEFGVESHTGTSIAGLYYDFYETADQHYGIILCESSAKGAEGVVSTSILRGMARSIFQLTSKPGELVTMLNELLYQDQLDPIFALSVLILNPSNNQLTYISTGTGKLWKIRNHKVTPIESDNIGLGIDPDISFHEVESTWEEGDVLVLNTFSTITDDFTEEHFASALEENAEHPPQRLVENVMRKSHTLSRRPLQERPITLLAFKRRTP